MLWHTNIPDGGGKEPSYGIPTYRMEVAKNQAMAYQYT